MSTPRSCFLLSVVLFCWTQSVSLAAQELRCDSIRPLPDSPSSYKKRGNRCEGLYVADVGAHNIDVVSFTSGDLNYDIASKVSLRVSVSSQSPLVNVRAVAIPPRTYYRMDTVLRPGTAMVWPVSEVLLPEKLTDNRIGIFGWTGTENAKTFVPVRVAANNSGQPTRSAPVLLTVQPSFDAESIKWRWAQFHNKKCAAFAQWQDAVRTTQVRAGQPVRIDLQRLPKSLGCVEIAARSRNSNDWATLQIHIEIPDR
jgi:hypothetical protein